MVEKQKNKKVVRKLETPRNGDKSSGSLQRSGRAMLSGVCDQ